MTIMPMFERNAPKPRKQPGPRVVMLNATPASGNDWLGLMYHLNGRFAVEALNLPGHGLSPLAPVDAPASLDEIAIWLRDALRAGGAPVHLIGHGFAGVAAMKVAALDPGLVASLTLVEPTAFNAIYPVSEDAWQAPADLRDLVANMRTATDEGDALTAMNRYADFFFGTGAWERTSTTLKYKMAHNAGRALDELRAITADQMCGDELAGIVCPVLLIDGARSRWFQRLIADELEMSVPFVQRETIKDAGHVPHLSDPHVTEPMICEFLVRVAAQWQDMTVTFQMAA